ncbi:MAG: TonB-dependent receptor [Methylobacter sp.]|uniref:TonB-dependent siderophore receptor n=1 Tax=Methylobacter sp. TaxID=2051955 RepID=UPI0027305CA0|nr:TonB-dependent receptor [Methylobacter sp.]MDP1665561.1 TonB-dependent receptor [Methylobacter sp.]
MVNNKKKNFYPDEIDKNSGKKLRACLIKGVFVLTFCHAVPALSVTDNAQKIQFDMPSSDLASALNNFAEKTGMELSYPASMVAGAKSKPLKGSYGVQQGLNELLRGTGLAYRLTGDNSVTLEKMAVAEPQSDTITLKAMTVTEKTEYDADKLYASPNSSSATKTDTPIMETPMSIQVVPRAVMQDQQTTRVKDAVENVSGVRSNTTLGYGTGFIIRGFRNSRVFRNGLVANGISTGTATELDTANLQSVEVLKGPAAMLFGRIEPGGLINVNTKRAERSPRYAVEQRFGSYDFYRTEWDATGSLTDDQSLSYRFSGSYQNNNSFRDFNFNDRVSAYSSLTWNPSDATEMSLDVEGLDQDFQVDRGLFAIGDRPAAVPVERSYIDPNDPVDTLSNVNLGFNLTHAFNKDWTLHNRFLTTHNDSSDISVKPANAFTVQQFLDPSRGNRTYLRNIFAQTVKAQTYTTNVDLTGNTNFLGTQHKTLVGFDYLRSTGTYLTRGNFVNPVNGLGIDIYEPVYGINSSFYDTALATPYPAGRNHSYMRDEWYGVYFQDDITLWDSVHLVGGGRYDWAKTGRGVGDSYSAAEAVLPSRNDEGFSPRVGVLYQPVSWMSVYGNWTTSFGANNGVTASGATIDPEIGEQFEAGFKSELFEQRLTTTLAYYHLAKENIMTRDLNSPDPSARTAIGEARSQGIELDMIGQMTDGFSLIGNYAYTDARITKDNSGLQDHKMNNVPEHSGSLWLKYEIQNYEPLKGWSAGLGMFASGQRQGDDANTFALPGYARLDAFAAYRYDFKGTRLTTQFNIRNLLDKTYYESTDPFQNAPPRVGIYPGAPLTAMGSIRLEF